MNRVLFVVVLLVTFLHSCSRTPTEEKKVDIQGPVVILKLDDLRDNSADKFETVANFIIENDLKASFGINGKYLEGKGSDSPFVQKIKYWDSTGQIEIWHHGWDHSRADDRSWYEYKNRELDDRTEYADLYSNSNYERQFADFKNTMDIVKKSCGITIHSFGTPYNQNDETCVDVLNQFPEMKVALFPRTPVTNQLALSISTGSGRLNIEDGGAGKANFDYFLANYESYDHTTDYMVLQAHPGYFDKSSLESFKKICQFLADKGHTFMTPYEYFIHTTGGEMPQTKAVAPPVAQKLVPGTENILKDGDFSAEDGSPWSLYNAETALSELSIADGEAFVEIITPGEKAWDIQLKQADIALEQGKKYRVTFTARTASGARTIESNIIEDSNTKLAYTSKETFSLTAEPKQFSFDFTMNESTTASARLRFRLGTFQESVYFDSVTLIKYIPE